MESPSPDVRRLNSLYATGGVAIHSAPGLDGDDDNEDGLAGNRCGRGGHTHVNMLQVEVTGTREVGFIQYADFATTSFGDAKRSVKRGENRARIPFGCGERGRYFLVIQGHPEAAFDDEKLGIGKYVSQIRAGHLSMLWADGDRIKEISVVKWTE